MGIHPSVGFSSGGATVHEVSLHFEQTSETWSSAASFHYLTSVLDQVNLHDEPYFQLAQFDSNLLTQ